MANEPSSTDTDRDVSSVTIGDVTGGILGSTIGGRDVTQTVINFFGWGRSEVHDRRNQLILLNKVKDFWVEGVLKKSVHNEVLIELGKEERSEAIEHPWDLILATPDQQNRQLPAGKRIIDIFNEMGQALLILGDPGSGKTITLLELARDTIACAEKDPTQPIPVVLNLSSRTERQQSLIDWVVEELNAKYQIPKRIGRTWVENNHHLLLLDGLDEVEPAHRIACVEAINWFRHEYGLTAMAICSRVAEYHVLATQLNLQGAILLQPLTVPQITTYLAGAGPMLAGLRAALQHDATLQELAQSPLMLSIMTLASQDISAEALETGQLNSTEARRDHIFAAYVAWVFKHRRADQDYAPEQTINWLTWLAQKMVQHNQPVFLLEQVQASWLSTRSQRWVYVLSSGLVGTCGIGLGVTLCAVGVGRIAWNPMFILFLLSTLLSVCLGPGLAIGLVDRWRFGRRGADPTGNPLHTAVYWRSAIRVQIISLFAILGFGLALVALGLALGMKFGLGDVGKVLAGIMPIMGVITMMWFIPVLIVLLFGLFFRLGGRWRSTSRDIQTGEGLVWSWRGFLVPFLVIGVLLGGITYVIAAATWIPGATLWDAKGKVITFLADLGRVQSADFNGDGTRIVTISGEDVRLWEGKTGKLIATFANEGRPSFSPDGTRILTVDRDRMRDEVIRLRDAQAGKLIASLEGIRLLSSASWHFSPDTTRILIGDRNIGFHQLWEARAGTPIAIIKGYQYEISPDWMRILTNSTEGVRLWDGKDGKLIATLAKDPGEYKFGPNGTRILTVGRDSVARLWDAKDGTLITTLEAPVTKRPHNDLIHFNRDGTRILTTSKERVQLWEGKSGRLIATLAKDIEGYEFGPDGTRILTLGRDDVAWLWDAQDGALIPTFKIPLTGLLSSKRSYPVQDENGRWFIVEQGPDPLQYKDLIRFNRDGSRILTDSMQGVQLWEGKNGQLIATLTKDREMGRFGPDGRRILTSSAEGVRMWDGLNGQLIATFTKANDYNFSTDGTRVVTIIPEGTVQLWDSQDGTLITTINDVDHISSLNKSVSFSLDGTRIVTITDASRATDYRLLSVAWLPLGLLIGFLKGVRASMKETKSFPNQGIWLLARNAVLVGFSAGLSVALTSAFMLVLLDQMLASALSVSLGLLGLFGILTALFYGGLDTIQHFILRLILSYEGHIPWKWARFLDHAAERILLRKVGGGYIFIHRLLLEYLSRLD